MGRLATHPVPDVLYFAIDTDERLSMSEKVERIIVPGLPGGSGRAARAAYAAAQRSSERFAAAIPRSRFALILASFGGGTGAGVAPVVAQFARQAGALTAIVAIEPMDFEGSRRCVASREAIQFALDHADAVIRVPNRDLAELYGDDVAASEALQKMDTQVVGAASAIVQIALAPVGTTLDLGVLRRVLVSSGLAVIGWRESPEGSLRQAVRQALAESFLYPEHLRRATHILLYVQGGRALPMRELRAGSQTVAEFASEAELLVGLGPAAQAGPGLSILVLACGLQESIDAKGFEAASPVPEAASPCVVDGENLDIPAFIRRQRRFGA